MSESACEKLCLNWRPRAQKQWEKILIFYTNRNQSPKYSEKLNRKLEKMLDSLSNKNFLLGEKTSRKNVRRICLEKRFAVFIRMKKDSIEVTSIVDARRNVQLY